MRRLALILTGLSFAILLLSLNRLTTWTLGYLHPYDFLRWLDFNAMLPIPLLSVLLYYLLWHDVTEESNFLKTKKHLALIMTFITGVYLFGASSGTHEFANYLNSRFCEAGKSDSQLCRIIIYNDDEFSHYVYYTGLFLMNVVLLLAQSFAPNTRKVSKLDLGIIAANAIFIGLGIFANLAFEDIGIDLYYFGSVLILSTALLLKKAWQFSKYPVLFYFALSYGLGVLGTLIYKTII